MILSDDVIAKLRKAQYNSTLLLSELLNEMNNGIQTGNFYQFTNFSNLLEKINNTISDSDYSCFKVFAFLQPMISDFRYVFSILKSNIDLKRIAEESVAIAYDCGYIDLINLGKIRELSELTTKMAKNSLKAMENADILLARKIITDDKKANKLYLNSLAQIGPEIHTGLLLRRLERIGDHSKNIASLAIYAVSAGKL